jgi:predicted lipid-binding transport protein (Tim44 family)
MLSARRQAAAGGYGQPAMAKSGYGNTDLGGEARPGSVAWPEQSASSTAAPVAAAPVSNVTQVEIDDFMKIAREQFTRLQAIWDKGDIHALADFCTPEMIRELSHQIAGRRGADNQTQVVNLDAEWLGMTDATDDFGKPVDEVQVRFSGLIREAADAPAVDFDEIWTLHRVKSGDTGWQLAGITQVNG